MQTSQGGVSLPARLRRWLEGEARALLTEDLSYYCLRASLPTPRLSLTSARLRFIATG